MTALSPIQIDPTLDLVLEREVDIAPELVWKAWTTPEYMKHWFAPKPWETPNIEIDLYPGGKFHTVMRSPEGDEYPGTGCILEVAENQRLTWTSAMLPGFRPANNGADAMEFTAIITIESNGSGGTKYTAIAKHKDASGRNQHDEMGFLTGWGTCFDQLVEYMKSL